ncbi:DUF3626 domain-containing protein [Ruegeria sp. Ofav3-42]|uniref:DUF3626 domain-containing protein n=1 Tax=Ruegeria sp. Ofav3-42 TaxID=2917759 RepID=UPI001EF44CC4|nr:DUF3626 domain-containing protein [Ruegeria sp. Ofav3-42]MCG7522665.1 DUF3626 domain-containing protein [Ruegeria sp. Ofav3-42]
MLPPSAQKAIDHVRRKSSGPPVPDHFQVTLNFHPDALHGNEWMIEVLARECVYRSQFETGNSNGGLTAHPGGDRWDWESRIFGAAYDNVEPSQRPKYGALNHLGFETGGSPRFGSCHLRLRPHVLSRSTYCYPDSYFDPTNFGVADRMSLISLAAHNDLSLDELDDYIEAHVHGPLVLAEDVEAAVLDPSYRDTEIEVAAQKLECPIEWHSGYRLSADCITDCIGFRGQSAADMAVSLVENDSLAPRQIGLARKNRGADPQLLKRVWHCVARFGKLNSQ